MQERVESGQTEHFIEHKDVPHYIINTHAFHNAHLLRETLPRSLTAPIPLFQDRKVKHFEIAAKLRETQGAKRQAAEKKKEQMKEGLGGDGGPGVSKKRKTAPE
jgi:hypothetical protein